MDDEESDVGPVQKVGEVKDLEVALFPREKKSNSSMRETIMVIELPYNRKRANCHNRE